MKHLLLLFLLIAGACKSTSVKTTEDTLGVLPADTRVALGTVTFEYSTWTDATPEEIEYAREHEGSWINAFREGFERKCESLEILGSGQTVDAAVVNLRPGNQALRYWVGFGAGSGFADVRATVGSAGGFKVRDSLSVGAWGGRFEDAMVKLGDLTARRVANAVKQ